jgi:MOSC domain-containing protein YiiM
LGFILFLILLIFLEGDLEEDYEKEDEEERPMNPQPAMRIEHLYISSGHSFFGHYGKPPGEHPMIECAEVRCVAGRGIEGDRFFDFKTGYKGQITFFEGEVYDQLCAEFDAWDRPPSVFRRNVITRGAALPALIGIEFEVQGVRFLGTGESAPCEWMNVAFAPGAEERLKGFGGLRAKILSDGVLRVMAAAGGGSAG